MNAKKTIAIAAAIVGITMSLTACGGNPDQPMSADIPEVVVQPTSSPTTSAPADTEPEPDVVMTQPAAPAGEAKNGEDLAITAPVDRIVVIPWDDPKTPVDVQLTSNDGVLMTFEEASKAGKSMRYYKDGETAPKRGIVYYTSKTGTATGSLRVLGDDFKPTGEGINFTVTVK